MSAVAKPEDPSPILACTVSRDVQDFELLIDEMEAEFGEAWGDLLLHEALAFLDQPDAAQLEVLALALSDSDSGDIELVLKIVEKARSLSIGVLLMIGHASGQTSTMPPHCRSMRTRLNTGNSSRIACMVCSMVWKLPRCP